MSTTEFFRYLLGCEPTAGLAIELIEAYGQRTVAARSR
jgi:hypothetical protein